MYAVDDIAIGVNYDEMSQSALEVLRLLRLLSLVVKGYTIIVLAKPSLSHVFFRLYAGREFSKSICILIGEEGLGVLEGMIYSVKLGIRY